MAQRPACAARHSARGQVVGKQLSPGDLKAFNDARAQLISSQSEQGVLGKFQRDAHVIADVADVAELADLYEVEASGLSPKDPRQFYFSLLALLRQAEPQPHITPLTDVGIGCDIEAGLYWRETFFIRELNKAPDPHVQRMVADLERLRTFQRLCWALFNLAVGDIRQAKWDNITGRADVPNHVTPAVEKMDTPMRDRTFFYWVLSFT
jgi:hypothetical protein